MEEEEYLRTLERLNSCDDYGVRGWGRDDEKVSLQFVVVVRNSSDDVVGDVRAWAKKCFDCEGMTADVKDNVTEFLVVIVMQIRALMKMSRIEVALKLVMTLSMGYADVLTDFLVHLWSVDQRFLWVR
ncbi:hypothetical protein TrLO_g2292 [Triparma laevis f. longispina]|uniref:Uncharacterized protein n=1 Tax=Triparma laevis f. longispina TaxID=1714387 RepID=A0A9W7AAK9_9STRA|nr:hypothetical protein TrLO_g2292 [Triparma laevis f. longispina]